MEICRAAHHWAPRYGHRVLLMSPQFVKPCVKSNKNRMAVARALARPSIRFVAVKSEAKEHVQQVHRLRRMAVRNRTSQWIDGWLLDGIASSRGVGTLRLGDGCVTEVIVRAVAKPRAAPNRAQHPPRTRRQRQGSPR